MSNEVKITVSGNDAQMLALWNRQQAEILKNQHALIKMGEAGEAAGKKIGDGMSGAVGKMSQFVAGVTGIGSVIGGVLAAANQLKAEWSDLVARQNDAAQRQLSTAAAQRKALINLGLAPDAAFGPEQLNRTVEQISRETGATQKDLFLTFSSALSAKGPLKTEDMVAAVKQAAQVEPTDQASQNTLAGAILDMMKKGGGTAQENFGLLLGTQGASRVKDLGALARNIVPGMIAGQSFGASAEQSAELAATFTQLLADPEGAISKTAMVQFMGQVQEATGKSLPANATFDERLGFLQGDAGKSIRNKLVGDPTRGIKGTLTGEAQALPAMKALLTGADGGVLAAARNAITSPKDAAGQVPGFLGAINAPGLQQQAELDRLFKSGADEAFLADLLSGRRAITREGIDKVLQGSGIGFTSRKMAGFSSFLEADIGGEDSRTVELRRLREFGEAPERRREFGEAVSDQDLAAGRNLLLIAERLEKLVELQQAANAKPPVVIEPGAPAPKVPPAAAVGRPAR